MATLIRVSGSVSRKQLMAVRSAAPILVLTVKSHMYTYFVIYVAYSFYVL